MSTAPRRWYHELNRYHWFVLIVAALGWLFDTMDQQLFNLARQPAMVELLAPSPGQRPDDAVVREGITQVTSIFMIGWATGGIFFGVLGDRFGRAKTMMLTILLYSFCTGLSAFSKGFWDFALYRFLTGLGVGGEFAVGVALVAEVMPDRARPHALGLLQALSAVGNITAALVGLSLGQLEQTGVIDNWDLWGIKFTPWRLMFVIGTLPALLAIVIRKRLKEPEQWKALVAAHKNDGGKQLGSYSELLGNPEFRRRALVGLALATSGVVGVWGIGFFSPELIRSVFTRQYHAEAREQGAAAEDRAFLNLLVQQPATLDAIAIKVNAADLINLTADDRDASAIYTAILEQKKSGQAITKEAVLEQSAKLPAGDAEAVRTRRAAYLNVETTGAAPTPEAMQSHVDRIAGRTQGIKGSLTSLAGLTLFVQNIGAFFGIYMFTTLTHYTGRRFAFAVSFILAMLSTILVFSSFNDVTDFYWMIPLMGFCQLSVFGGYAIYFPELFPTRLRSTGTSFCYNVGRYLSASGPLFLGYLSNNVFSDYAEPLRPAAITMCSVYLIGLLVLPFAPETKDRPLPE
ncbi:MAG: MFS transporter [Planctomycetia bacterium]|nr:MFS transporter [Planctomycetia bacterium]